MMQFLIFCFLLFSATAQAVPVPSSGMDWEKSSLKIMNFETPFVESRKLFSCFGKKVEDLPLEIDLARLGFEKQSVGATTAKSILSATDCFQAAGTYKIQVKLVDNAENISESASLLVLDPGKILSKNTQIIPSDVQQYRNTDDDFIRKPTSDCAQENLVANGLDTCNFSLTFHDEFGNRVPKDYLEKVTLDFPGLDASVKRLKVLDEKQNDFYAGIRLENGQVKREFSPKEARIDQSFKFGIKSWMPTLKILKSDSFPFLTVKTESLPVRLRIKVQEKEAELSEFNEELILKYEPLVDLIVDPSSSSESHFYTTLGSWSSFEVLPKFTSGAILPAKLAVIFSGKGDENSTLQFKGPKKPAGKNYQVSIDPEKDKDSLDFQFLPQSLTPELKSVFQLFGTIGYVVKDPIFGAKLIQYPMTILTGEELGKTRLAQWQTLQVGADIEGKVITKDGEDQDPSTIFFSQAQLDIREDLARNTHNLIRGIDPWDTDVINVNKDLSHPVSYVKGRNLRLTASNDRGPMVFGGGRRTIIIEDGNLLIDRDLVYESAEDSLGIILINKTPNIRDTGNLFINQNVKVFSGTYFLDGSLFSTLARKPADLDITAGIENRTETNNDNPNAPLGFQLLLNGTLISQNTWGGASRTPLVDPWKKEVDFEIAARYDLDYIRRYQPTKDVDNQTVEDKFNDYCVKVEGECDANPHAFIIRTDGRVKAYTPPGFSQVANISLISDS